MTRRVLVEADGGSRGNPGPAGYGAVVRDAESGAVLAEVAAGIGVASNNVAEYRGLIAGLQAAADLGADEVDVRMDSLLVVNQMSGVWKVKHAAMKPLASEAAALVRRFARVGFAHVPRERNTHADRLANEAMDAAGRGAQWERSLAPPPRRTTATASPGRWVAPVGRGTLLVLARHGETALSPERRFSGVGDPQLSERGRAQAEALAARLAGWPVTAVVTSPRQRARQTAEPIAGALGIDYAVEEGVAETDFGEWEGLTFDEVRRRWPDELARWANDPTVAPPGGESFAATAERVGAARDRLLGGAETGSVVVVVSHVTPIKTLLRLALDAPPHILYRLQLDPASLSVTDWQAGGDATVRLVNDTAHLGGDLVTRLR